jgi:cytosine/adenosine deaminase-related metal-dependent hydrolase
VVEAAGRFGMRVYMGLAFRSGRWVTHDGRRVHWELDEAAGQAGLQRAVAFFQKHDGAHGDLVKCFWSPAQIDTCTPDLLRRAKHWADETRRPYQVHTSQSVVEFNEMVARHGKTPIAWMQELGVLGPNTILGHAIIVGGSSWTNYPAGDVRVMADTGTSVAHAVWVFARRGVLMESFAKYRAAGVNMTLGTDTNPQNVIEAMRWAAVCSKVVERNTEATTAAHVFDAATLGGARALGRDDLGRIAPGAKADLVLWGRGEDLRGTAGGRRAHVVVHATVRLGGPRRRRALAADVPRLELSAAQRGRATPSSSRIAAPLAWLICQGRPAVRPPSTTSAWPVTNVESSLASQRAAWAMSSGRPERPIGCSAVSALFITVTD